MGLNSNVGPKGRGHPTSPSPSVLTNYTPINFSMATMLEPTPTRITPIQVTTDAETQQSSQRLIKISHQTLRAGNIVPILPTN